jgi:CRP-like cAMP-binding protein
MQTETRRSRPRNRLLSRLPDEDFERLAPHLRTLALTAKLVLQRPNEHISEIVFPEGGVVSVTTMMLDGSSVEVATIGAEGLVGINAFLGGATSNSESMVQVPVVRPPSQCPSQSFGVNWSGRARFGSASNVTVRD